MRCYSVQCMDNVHFDNLYNNTSNSSSATVVPQFVKSDPSLFKDDVDIRFNKIDYNYLLKLSMNESFPPLTVTPNRFSRTLNNCKVPQIRYATPERLLQRLTDLRFLSIDFLNTFLLTYRVFADGVQVWSYSPATIVRTQWRVCFRGDNSCHGRAGTRMLTT